MKKKILSLALAVIMAAILLSGCGSKRPAESYGFFRIRRSFFPAGRFPGRFCG